MHGLSDRLLAAFARANASRASATEVQGELLRLLAGTGVLDKMPDVDGPTQTSVGGLRLRQLEAGVVRLYGVVVAWCCVEGIAGWRYSVLVHSDSSFLW